MERIGKYMVCLVLGLGSCSAYAAQWPRFSLPDGDFLIKKEYIETKSCPPGQGKLPAGTVITMQSLCSGYCPPSWAWVAESDGECRDLTEFTLQRHEIIHYPDDENNNNGTVLYSEVNVFYGEKNTNESALRLVFTSPKEHWHCAQLDPHYPVITCANDM